MVDYLHNNNILPKTNKIVITQYPYVSLMPANRPVMKQRGLEMALQSLDTISEPSARLEQYPTPAAMVADILFIAKHLGDIDDKKILDLGCGNGVFAIGASLLGAEEVVGIDIDTKAIELSRKNASDKELDIDFLKMDVRKYDKKCDVVFQNPPFGSQKKHADRPFLEKAMECGDVVYTIHMTETLEFIKKLAHSHGFQMDMKRKYPFEIRHTFKFHKKEKQLFDVTMFRLSRKSKHE